MKERPTSLPSRLRRTSIVPALTIAVLAGTCSLVGSIAEPSPAFAGTEEGMGPELPRGGRTIFPNYRLVGYCGTPGAPALGELTGNLPAKARALETQAAPYDSANRKVMPVFELIAVLALSWQGTDGKYRRRVADEVVDAYLREARQNKALLLLNIQPGQSDFLTEVKTFEKYLGEPDVGIALDPEWAMKRGQVPGKYYGQTTGAVINDVASYLSGIVQAKNLPEKALVFHQVARSVVRGESDLRTFPGVVVIKSVDGLGPKHSKIETYDNLMGVMAPRVHAGFKLFFEEDRRNGARLMTPREVLALSPAPEYIMYE
jgi:hypothetical protein